MTDVSGEIPQMDETYQIKCPHCGSPRWTCWDEQAEDFEDTTTGEVFEYPVGYLRCNDCSRSYIDTGPHDPNSRHLGTWDEDRECYR